MGFSPRRSAGQQRVRSIMQQLEFPGLHNRLDAVFGALDAASSTDWKLQSSMICDDGGKGSPGEDDDEDAQDRCRPTADHPTSTSKLCSLSAFDVEQREDTVPAIAFSHRSSGERNRNSGE